MQCRQCSKEFEAKRSTARYCSAQCRKLAFQADGKVSVPGPLEVSVPGYEIVEGEKVYGRQAVRYQLKERWDTRPSPDSPDDSPRPFNRCVYDRPDGSSYLIDACGLTHGRNANGEVYAGMDYKQARAERQGLEAVV